MTAPKIPVPTDLYTLAGPHPRPLTTEEAAEAIVRKIRFHGTLSNGFEPWSAEDAVKSIRVFRYTLGAPGAGEISEELAFSSLLRTLPEPPERAVYEARGRDPRNLTPDERESFSGNYVRWEKAAVDAALRVLRRVEEDAS